MKSSAISDEQKNNLAQYGYEVVEEAEVGGYDLVLTHFPLLDAYHLALQRKGLDFSDPEQQMQKIPGGVDADMTKAIPVINQWIKKYKELWVAGNNPSKTPVYLKILKRLGYSPVVEDLMGIQMVSISEPSSKVASLKFTAKLLKP